MTPQTIEALSLARHGNACTEVLRDNYAEMLTNLNASSDISGLAEQVLDVTLNKPGVTSIAVGTRVISPSESPVSYFEDIEPENFDELVGSIAKQAFTYGLPKVYFIDVPDALQNHGRASNTAKKIMALGRLSANASKEISLIIVKEADETEIEDLDRADEQAIEVGQEDSESWRKPAAGQISELLSQLPGQNYRIASIARVATSSLAVAA